MSAQEETYVEEEEEKGLNAEDVTLIATDFLRRLGNNHDLKPIKVSLEEDLYIVEVGLSKKTATVQIDFATEQIKEYEIKEKEDKNQQAASSFFIPLTPKNIIMLAGISGAAVVISGLLGISSLIPSIF